MGEIGLSPDRLNYGLLWWEIHCIIKGYNRRNRDLWSSTRWQTYNLMASQVGGKALSEAGIHKPTDLIKFPWEKQPIANISDEDVAAMQAELAAINAQKNKVNPAQ